jgi:hypothetical protein
MSDMPQRFLRPGLVSSEHFEKVGWMTQSFYIRLLTLVDDFGRYEANPMLLRSQAFPLREDVSASQVLAMCKELAIADLVVFYRIKGKDYLQIQRWQERARSPKSFYPDPRKGEILYTTDNVVIVCAESDLFSDVVNPQDSAANRCAPLPPKSEPESSPSSSPLHPTTNVVGRTIIEGVEIPAKLDTPQFVEMFKEWVEYRKGHRAKCKDWERLFFKHIRFLSKFTVEEAVESLESSLINEYQGLFPPRGNGPTKARPQTNNRNDGMGITPEQYNDSMRAARAKKEIVA